MDILHEIDCAECGATFEPKRSDARFCSARCRVRHNRRGEDLPVTASPRVLAPELAVTDLDPNVCKCPDCRERATDPVTYWPRVILKVLADEEARPPAAVEDIWWATRCDYCGNLFDPGKSKEYWEHVETLDDGTEIVRTGTYCSVPCGEYAASHAGTVRG